VEDIHSGEADLFLYYVMPFIDCEPPRAELDRKTPLGVNDAVRIIARTRGPPR